MSRLLPGHEYRGHTYDIDVIVDPEKGRIYNDEIIYPDGSRAWLPWCDKATYEVRHFEAMVDIGVRTARDLLKQATGSFIAPPEVIDAYLIQKPLVIFGQPILPHQILPAVALSCAALVTIPFVQAVLP